jgi:hypothetical protein
VKKYVKKPINLMALPKKIKKDVDVKVVDPQNGLKNWYSQFFNQNKQFLPRDVDIEDMDLNFFKFIENKLTMTNGEVKGTTIFFGVQRWSEFVRTWENTDKYKNIKIPLIIINRENSPEVGTNPTDFKIPVRKNFPYAQIPVWDGNRKGFDLYNIPNPTGIDLLYTVRVLTFKMGELNIIDSKIRELFASSQLYVNVKGHYFPILLESEDDESEILDIDSKRYYVQTYTMRLQGYIVDSEEFTVKPAISRVFVTTELVKKRLRKPIIKRIYSGTKNNKTISISIVFPPSNLNEVSFGSEDDIIVYNINTTNIKEYIFKVNGSLISTPFTIKKDDIIYINLIKEDSFVDSEIILNGNIKE